jgi:hypothetical protein
MRSIKPMINDSRRHQMVKNQTTIRNVEEITVQAKARQLFK